MRRMILALASAVLFLACHGGGSGNSPPPGPPQNVIQIEIDDHGLLGLWQANAPNIKGLIARGVYGYSRCQVPTHSNQGNYSTLTGQMPEADDVPGNAYLDRPSFTQKISFGPLALGDYAFYPDNPLLVRGDSVYQAARRAGIRSAYFGELPPFEAGADEIHFAVLGNIYGIPVDKDIADSLLTGMLGYPQSVVDKLHLDGPPNSGETYTHFTLRDLANFIQATTDSNPMPRYVYVWDFLAVDSDPTSEYGAEVPQVIEDYDDALGEVLDALDAKGLADRTDIVFTLDQGKVDSHNQAVFGTHGTDAKNGAADGQFGKVVAADGPALGVTGADYVVVNEDGDAVIDANVPDAGTAGAAAEQERVTHALVDLVQGGNLPGVDTTRTVTFDGWLGTRRFHDYRIEGPHEGDLLVFAQPDWTLNQVDSTNAAPGPFQQHGGYPYGRHGGFSLEEMYVPVIFAGPAFKKGVMLPHPVNQDDLAPTAMRALGASLTTAQGGPVLAAFAGDPGETIAQPSDMTGSQETILEGGGYGTTPFSLPGSPAQSAVVIDVAGLYYDEIFTDPDVGLGAQPFLALAAQGTVFENYWNRYRDWPVNEYEMLTGGYPVRLPDYIPFAEDDPAQQAPPAFGFLKMPVPQGFVADPAGLTAWRTTTDFGVPAVFDAAHAAGIATALVGQVDFHGLHIDTSSIDLYQPQEDPGSIAGAVGAFLAGHARSLLFVALGQERAGDHRSAAARADLRSLGETVQQIAAAAPGALLLVTSRGATTIQDPAADAYGPGSSRHVPLVVVGPNVRPRIVTSEDGEAADIPATVLVGLGLPSRTDFSDGTWAAGTPVGGIAQPTPAGATGGHALTRAYPGG